MKDKKFKVGVVSLTDPRSTGLEEERENYIRNKHQEVCNFLEKENCSVIDPMKILNKYKDKEKIFGIRNSKEVNNAAKYLKEKEAECLIIGCWHWTEPMLAVHLVREMNLPILLYAEHNPTWGGCVCVSAIGASLWEQPVNSYALTHKRVIGEKEKILSWIKGVCALMSLRKESIMLWGGSYCLRMEHLQDDIPKLKSFLIGDILQEGEYILIKRAEEILKKENKRIENFLNFLKKNKCKIIYDNKMLNEEILKKQIAQYLSARGRLKELKDEPIIGASIHCQPVMSEEYGVDACLIPAFLPFLEDSEGKQDIIPTVCEGDIKGLLTSAILHKLNPDVPPLFGDLKFISKNYIIISNCGASSIYYANNSNKAKDVLPYITISAQCQGKSGGAIGYFAKPVDITVARLVRISGKYYMQMAKGRILKITEQIKKNILWGRSWPHIVIEINSEEELLKQIVGSNHYCATVGDVTEELTYFCREAGISIIRMDSSEEMKNFLKL